MTSPRANLRMFIIGVLALAPLAFSLSAAETDPLLADKIAVERVYYARQVGAQRTFEEVMPRAILAARVAAELRKERILKKVYGQEITAEVTSAEVARIERSTLDAAMLGEIKKALGNDSARFARSIARPMLVDRALRVCFAADDAPQAERRKSAESLRARLLAADPSQRLKIVAETNGAREITWFFAKRAEPPGAVLSTTSFFGDLHPEMQRVLKAQLNVAGDVSAVFASDSDYALYVAVNRTDDSLRVKAVEIPRLSFDEWLSQQPDPKP